jgi:hypothetical protein
MAKIIRLNSDKKRLLLVIDDNLFWCNIYLNEKKKGNLGGATFDEIRKFFLSYLKKEKVRENHIDEIKGTKLWWILTLAEKYNILYGSTVENGHGKIICRDRNNKIFPIIELSRETVNEWIEQLENFDKYIEEIRS